MTPKEQLRKPLLALESNVTDKQHMLSSPLSPTLGASTATYDYLFKVLLVGDSGCGKSSILRRYVENTFSNTYSQTIGVDFKIRSEMIEDAAGGVTKIKLQIWDTTGQERFRTITNSYYKGSHIFLVIYDVSDEQSFQNVQTHLTEIEQNAKEDRLYCIMIIGNKCDLPRVVELHRVQHIAHEHNIAYMECSARTGQNVEKMMKSAVITAVKKRREIDHLKSLNLDDGASSHATTPSVTAIPSSCCCTLL